MSTHVVHFTNISGVMQESSSKYDTLIRLLGEDTFLTYHNACVRHDLKLGKCYLNVEATPNLIHVGVRGHWKSPMKLENVEVALRSLVEFVSGLADARVAIMPLYEGRYGDLPKAASEELLVNVVTQLQIPTWLIDH